MFSMNIKPFSVGLWNDTVKDLSKTKICFHLMSKTNSWSDFILIRFYGSSIFILLWNWNYESKWSSVFWKHAIKVTDL